MLKVTRINDKNDQGHFKVKIAENVKIINIWWFVIW